MMDLDESTILGMTQKNICGRMIDLCDGIDLMGQMIFFNVIRKYENKECSRLREVVDCRKNAKEEELDMAGCKWRFRSRMLERMEEKRNVKNELGRVMDYHRRKMTVSDERK